MFQPSVLGWWRRSSLLLGVNPNPPQCEFALACVR
jgi:hypothetical protein